MPRWSLHDDKADGRVARQQRILGAPGINGLSRLGGVRRSTGTIGAASAVTLTGADRGQLLVMSGTVTIPAGGGPVLSQMTEIVDQVGFGQVVDAGDDVVLPFTATYWVHPDVRYTDGYRGGGSVKLTLDGVPRVTWPARPWGRFGERTTIVPGHAGQGVDFRVTPTDGAEHTAEVTVRMALVEPIMLAAPGTTLGFFDTAVQPDGLAFDGTHLWVACAGDNRVYRHDPWTGVTGFDFAAPSQAGSVDIQGLTWDGSHLRLARAGSAGFTGAYRLYRIDPDGTPVDSFGTWISNNEGNVAGVEWDGSNLWLGYASDGKVRKWTDAGVYTGTSKSPPNPASFVQGIHRLPDGFYATCAVDDNLYRVDDDWTLVDSFEIIPGSQGPSTAGSQDVCIIDGIAFVANSADDRVYRVAV